jgi:hypothetical protein
MALLKKPVQQIQPGAGGLLAPVTGVYTPEPFQYEMPGGLLAPAPYTPPPATQVLQAQLNRAPVSPPPDTAAVGGFDRMPMGPMPAGGGIGGFDRMLTPVMPRPAPALPPANVPYTPSPETQALQAQLNRYPTSPPPDYAAVGGFDRMPDFPAAAPAPAPAPALPTPTMPPSRVRGSSFTRPEAPAEEAPAPTPEPAPAVNMRTRYYINEDGTRTADQYSKTLGESFIEAFRGLT